MLKEFKKLFAIHDEADDIYSSILYDKVELDYYATHTGISISIEIKFGWRSLTKNSFMATPVRLQKIKELHEQLCISF